MPPVADDWGHVTYAARSVREGTLWRQPLHPRDIHWSPLWFLVNAIAYSLSPGTFGVVPLAFVKTAALMVLLIAAFILLRTFFVRFEVATVSALTLAFHQASVAAFYQWKAAGGLCSCAAGAGAIVLIVRDSLENKSSRTRAVLAAMLLAIALLFKETALCFGVLAALLLIGSIAFSRGDARRNMIQSTIPSVAVTIFFLAVRTLTGASLQLETVSRYRIGNPVAWIVNESLLIGAAVSPVSTLWWFDALHARHWLQVAIYFVITLVFSILTVVAIARMWNGSQRPLAICILGLISAGFPVVLLNHVSETYVAPALFWYSMLLGITLQSMLRIAADHPIPALAVLGIFLSLHGFGFADKISHMRKTADSEVAAMERSIAPLRAIPDGSRVIVENADAPLPTNYSVYREFNPSDAVQFGLVRQQRHVQVIDARRRDAQYIVRAGSNISIIETEHGKERR